MDKKENHDKNEYFIIILITLACLGLTLVDIALKWELWVPPLFIIGAFSFWVMAVMNKPDYETRKVYYVIYAMIIAFFHGVHETSLFDVSIIIALMIVAYSYMNRILVINLFLAEYAVIMVIQISLAVRDNTIGFDALDISKLFLHISIVLAVYYICTKMIDDRLENGIMEQRKDDRIEAYEADMEDFLSNISHELRTPVNVVNGMSDLLIKKDVGQEVFSIKDAGIRLAYQIEDIQDYTECKRQKLMLEEEPYASISLINDVVTAYRMIDENKNLELVVDLAPEVPTMMIGDIKKLHKIFRHLLQNAVKFTKNGGIYVKMAAEKKSYGVNLCIEMTDTGIGMDRRAMLAVSEGLYQVNKKRNRSSGGIGLGLYIVYGFVHRMGGFVKIESERNAGTTIRITIPQMVEDYSECLSVSESFKGDILFHVRSEKYKVPKVRDFYRSMAVNLASGIRLPLYPADTVDEIESLMEKLDVRYIFMGQEEYEENSEYFDEMSKGEVVVAVSASSEFKPNKQSRVVVMPKPLYAYPVIKVLNEGRGAIDLELSDTGVKPSFAGLRALVVDDEPMNLVVASGLFADYDLTIETAGSGMEAINKFHKSNYDIVFMDHMMPEMDGVEAMKHIKKIAEDLNRNVYIIALTANAVSGAREMFIKEGFDGFIAKPISIAEFERVMLRVLPDSMISKGGND